MMVLLFVTYDRIAVVVVCVGVVSVACICFPDVFDVMTVVGCTIVWFL